MSSEDRDGGLGDGIRRATTAYGARLLVGLVHSLAGLRDPESAEAMRTGNSKVVEFAGLA
jgi:hypothetical protein